MKHNQQTVPFAVRVRAFRSHALIALIALAAFVLAFQFFIGNAAGDVAELKRVKDSPTSEIVFAGEQNPGESFYYLKNHAVAGGTRENAVSDILMLMPDVVYGANSVYFSGTLEEGTCAVSANIAARYALEEGDHARVIGTDKTFRVARILPAEAGIDEDYLHEGIVILSFDGALLNKNYLYVTFGTDGDAYRSLHRLVFVEDLAKGCGLSLSLYALAAVLIVAALMALGEGLLFRARRADYALLVTLGVRRGGLLLRVLLENALKYLLPLLAVSLGYTATLGCYGVAYAIPVLGFLAVLTLSGIVYSLIVVRRLYYVRAR